MDYLIQKSTARDFVADAYAHCKFIGYVDAALPLLGKAGIAIDDLDEGCITLGGARTPGIHRYPRQASGLGS